MCCTEFIVKYALFFFNLVFTLAGIALVVVGVVVILQLDEILELIPVNINVLPIAVIVVGCVVFVIAFFGCCGAIRESRCLLVMYAICMLIIAALKIWLTVVIFNNLNNLNETVQGWLNTAFNNQELTGPYHVLESAFSCCGTTGSLSYIAQNRPIPGTCCGNQIDESCTTSTYGGCTERLGNFFETYGEAVGTALIIIIIVELVAMLFAFYLNHNITEKRRARY